MKKRVFSILICATVILCLAACTQNESDSKTREVSSISGVSFNVLQSWTDKGTSQQDYGGLGRGEAIEFSFKKDNTATVASIETSQAIILKPSESIEVMQSQLLNSENIKEKNVEEINVAGKPAARASINATENNAEVYGEIVVIENDKQMIIIVARGKAEQKDTINKIVQTILDSFKFL